MSIQKTKLTSEARQIFEDNYKYYLGEQNALILKCEEILKNSENEHERENAIRHLEQFVGRSTTAKKLYGAASHHFHLYNFSKFLNVERLSPKEFEDRYSWKFTFAKKFFKENEDLFKERDLKILKLLESFNSKYLIKYEDLISKKEYFNNFLKDK